jgi:glycosyltransferase involved in cell wall biosynthesis
MNDIQAKLDYADAIAHWFLEIGETHGRHGRFEEALKCVNNATWILARQNRTLSCERLESTVKFIAESLTNRHVRKSVTEPSTPQTPTCLHVLSEALPAGGVTALAIRWMKSDRSNRTHSAAILSQQSPIPDEFFQTVSGSGGCVHVANPAYSLSQRAIWLRGLASDPVTLIVMHASFSDMVVWGAAFGVPGGPPLVLVNHAANLFWGGGSIVDLVLNVRGSELEKVWTVRYRGIPRCATVPIPLTETNSLTFEESPRSQVKRISKESLGVSPDSVVILTVGAHFKYLPIDGLDFVAVFERILCELPNTYLVAVGFEADRRWREASSRVESRIRVLGVLSQSQLEKVHEATDLYVEGFPFGTTTALLEAAVKGIPVVLSPAQCPPPYGSDGVALDSVLSRAQTLEEYRTNVIRYVTKPHERAVASKRIRESIIKHHTGQGWMDYLAQALADLPREHEIYSLVEPVQTPSAIHENWTNLTTQWSSPLEETFDNAVVRALSMGIRPHMTDTVLQACKYYRAIGVHKGVPVGFAFLFCNVFFRLAPVKWAKTTFRVLSFLYRPSFFQRVRSQIHILSGGQDPRNWYGDYRSAKQPK